MGEHKLPEAARQAIKDEHESQSIYYWVKFSYAFRPSPLHASAKPSQGVRFEEIGRLTPITRAKDLMDMCNVVGQKVFRELEAMPGDNLQMNVESFQRFEEPGVEIARAVDRTRLELAN